MALTKTTDQAAPSAPTIWLIDVTGKAPVAHIAESDEFSTTGFCGADLRATIDNPRVVFQQPEGVEVCGWCAWGHRLEAEGRVTVMETTQAPCPCTGEEHLDTRDAIYETIDALRGLGRLAAIKHSVTSAEAKAFMEVERLLRLRAEKLQRHAYEAHGVERMTR